MKKFLNAAQTFIPDVLMGLAAVQAVDAVLIVKDYMPGLHWGA